VAFHRGFSLLFPGGVQAIDGPGIGGRTQPFFLVQEPGLNLFLMFFARSGDNFPEPIFYSSLVVAYRGSSLNFPAGGSPSTRRHGSTLCARARSAPTPFPFHQSLVFLMSDPSDRVMTPIVPVGSPTYQVFCFSVSESSLLVEALARMPALFQLVLLPLLRFLPWPIRSFSLDLFPLLNW